jgi:hypothetical protein
MMNEKGDGDANLVLGEAPDPVTAERMEQRAMRYGACHPETLNSFKLPGYALHLGAALVSLDRDQLGDDDRRRMEDELALFYRLLLRHSHFKTT